MYEWDEKKRRINLEKHGFDFSDAYLVYENKERVTLTRTRGGEARKQDLAVVEVHGVMLSLAYVERADRVRVISLRKASRKERAIYADQSKTDWARVKEMYDSDAPIPYDDADRAEGLYDPNDDAAVEAAWASGTITYGYPGKERKPAKQSVSIRLSPAVLEHFKSKGKGWQTEMDRALLQIVEQQQSAEVAAKKVAG